MSRLIAYICNDDNLTPVAFEKIEEALDFEEVIDSTGIGFGWVQDGRSLLRTIPRPGKGEPRFVDMFSDIPSRSVLGHFRGTDLGPVKTLNLQPFRFRKWVFAYDGEVPELPGTLEEIAGEVPEFIRSNIKGDAPAEVVFHLFLARLQQRDLLSRGRTNPRGCARAMAETVSLLESRALADFRAIGVTDRTVVAARVGSPLYYQTIRGLEVRREKPLFAGHSPKAVQHPSFKAIVVTDALDSPHEDWSKVPDSSVLWLDRDWEVRIEDINSLRE